MSRFILRLVLTSTLGIFAFLVVSTLVSTSHSALAAYAYTKDLSTVYNFPFTHQEHGNYCGPAVLEEVLDWRYWIISETVVFSQDSLMFYMVNNASDPTLGGVVGALPTFRLGGNNKFTTYGTESNQVRRLNTASDYGTDPHALAWTLYEQSPLDDTHYHYYLYSSAHVATMSLLKKLEQFNEPIIVAFEHGWHWVLVLGYSADHKVTNGDLGTSYEIIYFDPLYGRRTREGVDWENESLNLFSAYALNVDASGFPADPDPSISGYTPPPSHWLGKYVTIEPDYSTSVADNAVNGDTNNFLSTHSIPLSVGGSPSTYRAAQISQYRFNVYNPGITVSPVYALDNANQQALLAGIRDIAISDGTCNPQNELPTSIYHCSDIDVTLIASNKYLLTANQTSSSKTVHLAKTSIQQYWDWLTGVDGQAVVYNEGLVNMYTAAPDWDVNLDHTASVLDIAQIGIFMGQTAPASGDPNDPLLRGWVRADANWDGVVNILDVSTVGNAWGQTW